MDSDALSLAEILETAEATLEIWHQVPTTTLGNNVVLEIALKLFE